MEYRINGRQDREFRGSIEHEEGFYFSFSLYLTHSPGRFICQSKRFVGEGGGDEGKGIAWKSIERPSLVVIKPAAP